MPVDGHVVQLLDGIHGRSRQRPRNRPCRRVLQWPGARACPRSSERARDDDVGAGLRQALAQGAAKHSRSADDNGDLVFQAEE